MTVYACTSNALTGGRWVNVRGVQRWVADPLLPVPANPADAIACRTCGAKASETCRNPNGTNSGPHATRSTPRCCPCGGQLTSTRALYCADCRREIAINRSRASAEARKRLRREKEAA